MIGGNIPDKIKIKLNYIPNTLTFSFDPKSQKRILFRPHQAKSIDNPEINFTPLSMDCDIIELDCPCQKKHGENIFDIAFQKYDLENVLAWIDTRNLTLECFSSIIYNWAKNTKNYKNFALCIPILTKKVHLFGPTFAFWSSGINGSVLKRKPRHSIWYPSLEYDSPLLDVISKHLNPYDVYPILDFSDVITEYGDATLTNHSEVLENTRTRTRHFMIFNSNNPETEFNNFYSVLRTKQETVPLIFTPVISPNGNTTNFLVSVIAGTLSDALFATPKNTIPIDSYDEQHGILVLRKVV